MSKISVSHNHILYTVFRQSNLFFARAPLSFNSLATAGHVCALNVCRIKQEWDLALINVLTAAACNAAVVWSLAPCRSYGNTFQFDLQNTLQKLPNNVFEKSYPFREFDMQKRIHSFFYKAAQLCFVGLTTGAVQGALSNLSAKKKDDRSAIFSWCIFSFIWHVFSTQIYLTSNFLQVISDNSIC